MANKPATKEVVAAFNHVKELYPAAAIVIYSNDGRWQYMDEDFNRFTFDNKIDTSLLEAAADSIVDFPAIFQF